MDNLPITQKKLNIFQKIKLKFYQRRKYGRQWFADAPEYIRQDEYVIRKMIKSVLQGKFYYISSKVEKDFVFEIFEKNPELFDSEDRKKVIEIIKKRETSKLKVISKLTVEELDEILDELSEYQLYPFISIEEAKYLINNNKFNVYYLKYCNLDVQLELMNINEEFVQEGSLEAQKKYLEENLQYLSQHPKYTKGLPKDIQLWFATKDKKNIRFLRDDYQFEIINNHPTAFTFITDNMKQKIFHNKEKVFLIKKVININFKNSKYLLENYDNFNNYYLKDEEICNEYFKNIADEINTYTPEQLENIFLKSGIIFARGTLRNYGYGYQDNGSDPYEKTIDIYRNEELQLIQRLSPEQIAKLIKIDSNYILAYVGNAHTQKYGYGKRIDLENEAYYRQKCKEVFKDLFGEEKLIIYEECINNIFKTAVKFEDRDINKRKNIKERQIQFPLESLKLLFNEKIINANDSEAIKEYYVRLLNGEDVKELFTTIIGNAYGEKAIQILKNREELDVYNINSLEIFDERILNNFSTAFVNDLLSYNIVGISSFFNIIKNEDDLKTFKQYYDLLSKVFGENIETMQKAISEYYYIDELLKNIELDKLNDKQYTNLISCICGNRNEFNITTLYELDNFNEIVNQQFIDEINLINEISPIDRYEYVSILKQKIFSNFFGLNFVCEIELIDELTEEEREIINCVNFIYWENDPERLKEIIEELLKNTNIRNPIALHTAINKIRYKTRIEPLKEKLLLKKDLDNACENLENVGKIRKEKCDNINIYYLTGIDFSNKRVLAHFTWNACGREIMKSESQLGMSTVSTWYSSVDGNNAPYLYTDIETEDLIGVNYQDAGTSHIPKVVRASRRRWKLLR